MSLQTVIQEDLPRKRPKRTLKRKRAPSKKATAKAKIKSVAKPEVKKSSKGKDKSLSLRIDEKTRYLIDLAADSLGQSRTEFMLSSARDRAIDVLLDQRIFVLSGADWGAFTEALDNPPPPNAKLKALLARKAPWET